MTVFQRKRQLELLNVTQDLTVSAATLNYRSPTEGLNGTPNLARAFLQAMVNWLFTLD